LGLLLFQGRDELDNLLSDPFRDLPDFSWRGERVEGAFAALCFGFQKGPGDLLQLLVRSRETLR
jgi:hypothetical protein